MKPRNKIILIVSIVLVLIAVALLFWYLYHALREQSPRGLKTEGKSPSSSTVASVNTPKMHEITAKTNKLVGPVKFLPKSRSQTLQILDQSYFTIGYDNQRKNPAWVVYGLTGPIIHTNKSPLRPKFQMDPRTSAHVPDSAYSGSGYDRGHLVPAYAQWSRNGLLAFEKTFILSNVVPQFHGMNAGIWEDLEDNIAGQVKNGDVIDQGYAGLLRNITVINGPIYEGRPTTLRNGTWVPTACFSIVLDFMEETGQYRAMAFEIPNQETVSGPLLRWSTTIKKIEEKTDLDFFDGNEEIRAGVETKKTEVVW